VRLDGVLRLQADTTFYPTRAEYVVIGKNRLPELVLQVGNFSGGLEVRSLQVQFVN
jgi:hypothetical protein